MKYFSVKIISLVTIILLQSCSPLIGKIDPLYKADSISYLYVSNIDTNINSKITLFATGDFICSENNSYILGELCQYNSGSWYKNEDTIHLTSYFQNNYIVDLGEAEYKDSIPIFIYSLQTEKPTNDFAFINEKDSLELPTTDGRLCISCKEKEDLTQQLLVGISDNNATVLLECGRKYRYYIKDCWPILFVDEKFIMTDSILLNIKTNERYTRVK